MVYLIALIRIKNITLMNQYKKAFLKNLHDYGGSIAFEGNRSFTLDDENQLGDFSECSWYSFPSEALARAWYESDAYENELNDRQRAADITLIGCIEA